MTLTKMSPSGWRYYAEEVSSGREDYFAVSSETLGRFVGRGAVAFGLAESDVSPVALERLFGTGADPRTGKSLGRGFASGRAGVVAGFPMSFSPPKSVSVLWACADTAISAEVLAAHEAAVEVAVAFLDEHGSFTRRGHNGVLQVDTEGLVGVTFVHRTSRAADPQLHTHLLIANKVRAADGKWLSIDGRELFTHQKAAGMLYKAALRAELTRRCDVAWTDVDENGIAEIVGVPQALADAWSQRRNELKRVANELIADGEADLGRTMTAGERTEIYQLAAYRTRTPKIDADTSTEDLRARWHDEAVDFGHDPVTWFPGLTANRRNYVKQRVVEKTTRDATYLAETIRRLEDASATFGRVDVVEVLSTLVTSTDAASMRARIEELASKLLAETSVICLAGPLPAEPPSSLRRHDGMSAIERHGAVKFTTKATLRLEASILDAVTNGQKAGVAIVAFSTAKDVLELSDLGSDQRAAVRALVTGGERVALLVGPAGAGKSRALDTARAIWEHGGYQPIGLAPSAMAAGVLAEEAGLRSETLAKFIAELERGVPILGERSVVILDEAGMARSDDLAKLIEAVTRANAKLVLVGDPQQLGAVGPGGIFRTLVDDHGGNELETVRRFDRAWEAAASLRLRARDASILPVYLRHDRIADGSKEQMIDQAFRSWKEARKHGASMVVMAGDNATASEIALRCRADLVASGEVTREGVRTATGTFGVGDEIVTLRNDRQLGASSDTFVRNGDRWRVTDTLADGSLRVASMSERQATAHALSEVILPAAYVREHVALGYALTVHKAQGTTTDRAVVIVDEAMTAPQLYVAMTRGREENRALVVTSDRSPEDHRHQPSVDAVELLGGVMRRDTADLSAHDVMRRGLATSESVTLLRELSAEADQFITRGAPPDYTKAIEALIPRADVERAVSRVAEAEGAVRDAQARREDADAAVSETERQSMRARLPGRGGEAARREEASSRAGAASELTAARRDERYALKAFDVARHELNQAKRSARALGDLQGVEADRQRWLGDHREEVNWANNLHARLETRTAERNRPAVSHPRPEISTEPEAVRDPQRFPRSLRDTSVETKREPPEPLERRPPHQRGREFEPEYLAPQKPMPAPSRGVGGPGLGR
jgi:conjugative relaxase-like TrwC/TraI family protein